MTRALYDIARDIEIYIVPLPPDAAAYVKWLRYLEGADDRVGETNGRIVLRNLRVLLRNCEGTRANDLKAELESIAGTKRGNWYPIGTGQFTKPPPDPCQLCGISLAEHGKFVVGSTVFGRTHATMCTTCHMFVGVGFGSDVGRLYSRRADGRWELLPVSDRIFTSAGALVKVVSTPKMAPWMSRQERHPALEFFPIWLRRTFVQFLRKIGVTPSALAYVPIPLRKAVGRVLENVGLKRLVVRNFFRER